MKVNELMIGDWVMNPNDGKCYKIHTVTACEQTRLSNPYSLTDLEFHLGEPIPLTAEILEKNGFVFRGDNDTMYGEYYLHNQSTFAIKMFNGYLVGMCMGEDLEFDYVHELQHALRLCGLNELADTFKI